MNHQYYIKRCFHLAEKGIGAVSPNPLVGAVLVHNNVIIGEGYHKEYGQNHAEVNAFNNVAEKHKHLIKQATLYVNLEPCNHHGNTPPCSDRILLEQVKQVVICNTDPNPLVSGTGIEKLQNNGIEVITGILKEEGNWLNRRFFTQMKKNRPYVLLKWAQSADGYIGRMDGEQIPISNSETAKYVHKWRSQEDAILVGVNTAINDNPKLTNRKWNGKQPIRILFDPKKRANQALNIFNNEAKTLVIHNNLFKNKPIGDKLTPNQFISLFFKYLRDLNEVKIQSILIEGGAQTLQHFIDFGFWDEARIIVSEDELKYGVSAPKIQGKILEKNTVGNNEITTLIPA